MSEETKRKLSESHNTVNNKEVVKYSMKGEFIKKYNSITEAENENDTFRTAISACCRNVSKTAGGYIWRYLDDPITQEHIDKCNSDGMDFRRNAICQYTIDGKFVAKYESAEYAQKECGYCASDIRKCCKGKQRTNHGYIWRYEDDIPTKEYIEWCKKTYNKYNSGKKIVYQYSLNGEFLNKYKSLTSINKLYGYEISSIAKCCRGKQKTSYGYIWKYANEEGGAGND